MHNRYSTNFNASYNPFRYRGYYYDTETGLYYLQSRYYNPQWGRFLNADGLVSTGQGLLGYNMYAYCNNNPVMYVDPTGFYSWEEFWEDAGTVAITVVDAFLMSIEAELRMGPGLDIEILNVELGYSNDIFVALDDGDTAAGHIASGSGIIFDVSARHYSEIGSDRTLCSECLSKDRYCTGIDYMLCSHSQHSFTTSLGPLSVDQNENYSLSLSAGAHVLYGGSISIGFNISEFLMRLAEAWA